MICDRYGPPEILRIEEVERPVPADDELLIRIRASTVNRSDAHNRAGRPFISRLFHGLRRPKRRIPGSEFAGEVAEAGAAVTEFEVGARVFGVYPFFDVEEGAHAEFMCIPERAPVVHMPDGMAFEDAAAVPDGAILALGCLRRVRLEKGQRILIYGASGSIGTAAVQWSRYFGRKQDLLLLKQLLEEGKFRPVIDRRYPLEDVVEATKYVETQQKTGNVVLMITP